MSTPPGKYIGSEAAGSGQAAQTLVAISFATLMMAAAVLLDVLTPAAVSIGFFYVSVVLAAFWIPWPRAPFALALFISAVIIARVSLATSPQGLTWVVWADRGSDIAVVWLATGFVWYIHVLSQKLRTQLAISNTLSREMAHRVGNSLQLVAAFLRLRAARVNSDLARQVLETAGLHVASIGRINRILLGGEVAASVDSKAFIEALVRDVSSNLPDSEKLPIIVQADSAVLTSTAAITLGALLIELITNALKHAFRYGEEGTLEVRFSDIRSDREFVLEVEDNGVGFNEVQASQGFGIQSMNELVLLMNGSASHEPAHPSALRPGTRWRLVFPRESLAGSRS